ncbi:MAG: glycoside hydrolase family 88 protein, partial [Tannerella sp.]|nr:glycoside hydrolase family 88 protein [Tannerella sp.]
MKKNCLLLLLICCAALSSFTINAQSPASSPDRRETLKTLIVANDYFMKKYADYTQPSYRGRLRPSNIWTRSVYY